MELAMGAMGRLLPKLGELLKDEYGLQKGVKKKIETLSRELEAAQAVLHDISDMPPDQLNELVKRWARDVREASYDMEDIIDTFLVHVDSPEPANPHKLRHLRKKVSSLFKKSKARRNISIQIQEIYKKLEELTARRDRYKTPDSIVNSKAATTIDPRIMNLYKSATEFVGIEGPKDELLDKLSIGDDDNGDVSDHKKMKIVAIVGFGGLGKTTLAKVVYDQLKLRFECRAFVPVGQNPDIKKVFRDILIALDENAYTYGKLKGLDENQLMGRLNEFVKEKRFLIVIDDIWDMNTWELVRCALGESKCVGRLVITTRNSEVAAYADEAYKIQPLSQNNSEKLFYARIADGEGKYFERPSAEACERILKKCSGVPLAIITIASLLASKPGEEWSEVYNSIGFGYEGNSVVDNTRRILSFSYYDLPSHLKTCLLYLSLFPEDHVIEKNSLIWKWIAEGFIMIQEQAEPGAGLFELGERYFNELINRSMIQPRETTDDGYVDGCSVHDMVLDLIVKLSREQNFVSILYGGGRQKPQRSISRRVALQSVEEHNVGQLANITVDKVRSIFASQCDFCALCPRLPFLRVTEMVECSVVDEDCGKDLSEDYLASLLHLRYLTLAGTFEHIPRNVRYLRFLQTLDLRNTRIREVPEEVALLTQLVCLRLERYSETGVPAGLIGKLTSLQELCIEHVADDAVMQFVKELGLLRELRVLMARIESLGHLHNIQELINESTKSALLESLGHLHNIRELQFLISVPQMSHDAGWLSCLHLRLLYLSCLVFSRLPGWINSSLAPNLSFLYLNVVFVNDQDMEILAKLPGLISLQLNSRDTKSIVSIKISTGEGVGYFRKLRFLNTRGLSLWFDLRDSECNSSRAASNTIMPSLESLKFDFHVQFLKDENPQLGFYKLLGGLQNLGTNSLQRVIVYVNCRRASTWDVEEAEAALQHAAAVHPKHPTLKTYRGQEGDMMSRYQEACMEMSRAPESVTKAWKLADIIDSEHIQVLRMPDPEASSSKVMRLLYTDSGVALLALSSNAVHKLWKWEHSGKNPHGKSSKSIPPVLWQPENGVQMTNDTIDCHNREEETACFALSRDDSYLFSASGGKVSHFDMKTFVVIRTFMAPPPAATFIAFLTEEEMFITMVIIGSEDSSIHIYKHYSVSNKAEIVLTGHQKKITGLAISKSKKVLISSGADAQLCVWSIDDGWEKKKSRYIQHPSDFSSALVGDTMVQFHYDETHLLVVHESQLAIYDWQLECLCLWFPRDALLAPISSAVYSIGCLLVYAGFCDGSIGIFEAESLTLQCRIAPSGYIPSSVSSGEIAYPTAMATHPWKPNQIAVGMSDGAVLVLEPLDTDDVQVGSNTDTEQCPPSDVSNSCGYSHVLDV